jgi:lysophospholipase L1-like esterase
LSIPGNTTEDVLRRFRIEAEAREPHIIIFAVGTNDSSCRDNPTVSRVSPEKFKENIRTLIDRAKHRTRAVVWIGLTGVDETRTTPFETTYFSSERISAYDAIIRELCAEYNVPYLDVLSLLQPEDLEDGLHPNKHGHKKLFHAVHDFLIDKRVI